MSSCAVCGDEEQPYGFSPSLGGLVCERCASVGAQSCFALTTGALATLRTLLDSPLAELDALDLDSRAVAEVEQVVTQTLAFHGH
jgi:recombinational DNA repair protein (RecF pathway)